MSRGIRRETSYAQPWPWPQKAPTPAKVWVVRNGHDGDLQGIFSSEESATAFRDILGEEGTYGWGYEVLEWEVQG